MTADVAWLLGIIGGLVTIAGTVGGLRYAALTSQREARKERRDEIDRAKKDAVEGAVVELNGVRNDLLEMTDQRNYWRQRCTDMENRQAPR